MTPAPYAAQKGFTLIELIIAITLAAMVVALGASILRMGMDFYRRAHEHIQQQQEIRGFLKLLRQELQGTTKGAPMSGQETWLDYYTSNVPVGLGRPGMQKVSLVCRENEQGQTDLVHRILQIKPATGKPAEKQTEKPTEKAAGKPPEKLPEKPAGEAALPAQPIYEEETLIRQLSQCTFSFLARDEKSPKPSAYWTEEWREGRGSPLAIRVRLATSRNDLPPVVIPLN